jgi:uncharacterized membrane protein
MSIRNLHAQTSALALAAALGSVLAGAANPAAAAGTAAATEKCFGVSLAGHNDCKAGPGTSCAGSSKKDFQGDSWRAVPSGTCKTTVSKRSPTGFGQLVAFNDKPAAAGKK